MADKSVTFTVEDFKNDTVDFEAFLRLHIAAIGSIDDSFPDEIAALRKSNLGMELYVEKINAWTQKQNASVPMRAAR